MTELMSNMLIVVMNVIVVMTVIRIYAHVHNTRAVIALADLVSHIVLAHVIMAIVDRIIATLMSFMMI